jgi:hypothetical protein
LAEADGRPAGRLYRMPALEGRIDDFSISEILQVIGMGRKTGMLEIKGAREHISVYFKEGKAVYANPVYQREHLGNILVKHGAVTRNDINDALIRQRELDDRGERVRVGAILVSMGLLSREELSKYIAQQIREAIYLIMAEESGTFSFTPRIDISPQDIVIGLDVEETILEGTRLIDEWGMIKEKLVDFDEVYSINANPSDDNSIQLTIDEWKILSLVDGRRSINDIIEVARFSRFEVCKIMYNFAQMHLVRKLENNSEKTPVETRHLNRARPERGIVRRLMARIRGV